MVQHRSTEFCGRGKVLPANINFDNRACLHSRQLQRLIDHRNDKFPFQVDDAMYICPDGVRVQLYFLYILNKIHKEIVLVICEMKFN